MITKEEFNMVHVKNKQGYSIRQIAKESGLDRRTVAKRLKEEELNPVNKRIYPSKLDKFKPFIEKRIKDCLPKRIPSSVIYSEIVKNGYTGKETILRDYTGKLYGELKLAKEEPLIRFETAPGVQMQIDWTTVRNGRDPIHCFLSVLGYSRYSFIYFTDNLRLETFLNCHIKAFSYYGGVTKTVLYDNLKSVMIKRNAYGEGQHKFNDTFLDFSKSLGFIPRLCMPYRAKTKGKVERFARFVKENFYYPLKSKLKNSSVEITSELLNNYGSSWLENINARIHGTTNKKPVDLFNEEKAYLLPVTEYKFSRNYIAPPELKIDTARIESYEVLLGGAL